MPKMHASVMIARPLEEVFARILAVDEIAVKTDPGIGSVSRSPEGPPRAGTTFRFRQETLGKVRETTTRYTAIAPNRRIDFDAEIGPMRPTCSLTFEATDRGTRVTFQGDANPLGPLKILSPFFNHKGQQVWTERLGRVKALLESDT